jgi:hypothetical protein
MQNKIAENVLEALVPFRRIEPMSLIDMRSFGIAFLGVPVGTKYTMTPRIKHTAGKD